MNERFSQGFFFGAVALSALVGASVATFFFVAYGNVWVRSIGGSQIRPYEAEEDATIAAVSKVKRQVVSIVVRDSTKNNAPVVSSGTGFFVSADGAIVTNRHVVDNDQVQYSVLTDDGTELPATLLAKDPFFDLAVLDVEGDDFPAVTLGDSDALAAGQTVIAIGNSLSEYQNTVTKGIISGLHRRVAAFVGRYGPGEIIDGAIQTDAAINLGNSGGPLINLKGEVLGVNTAASFQGDSIGFAIPINDVKRVVDDVKTYGRIVRPWLGVRYVMLDGPLSAEAGLSVEEGAWLSGRGGSAIVPDSPAAKAGLKDGDIILRVNEMSLTSDFALGKAISPLRPGDTVVLNILRGDETLDIPVTLEEADASKF